VEEDCGRLLRSKAKSTATEVSLAGTYASAVVGDPKALLVVRANDLGYEIRREGALRSLRKTDEIVNGAGLSSISE